MRLRLSPREAGDLARATGRHGPTLAALANAASERFGDRAAVVIDGERWTFDELWARAEGLALGLYLGALDRVRRPMVVACEGVAAIIATLAAGRLGIDVWLANPGRLHELARTLPPSALLVHDGEPPAWHPAPTVRASDALELSRVDGSGLAATHRQSRLVLMSAGTSGIPSPQVVRAFGVRGLRQLRGLHERVGIDGADTVVSCMRLDDGHGIQVLAACLLTGATLVAAPRTSSADRLAAMRERGATVLSASPHQLERLLDHAEATGESVPPVRRIVCGSGMLRPELVRRLHEAWGPVVMNAYGTTETGTITVACPDEVLEHPSTVGRPLPGTAVGIVGHRRGDDAEGRVWVRGASRTVITDDEGRIEDGMLTIVGRLDGRQR